MKQPQQPYQNKYTGKNKITMRTIPAIYDIFKDIEAQETPAKKKALLKAHAERNAVFTEILRLAFDPNVQFFIDPETKYKPCDGEPEMLYGRMYSEARRMYVFINPNLNIKPDKRQRLWADLLETVDPEDAKILASLPKKTLPSASITAKLVKSALPNLW